MITNVRIAPVSGPRFDGERFMVDTGESLPTLGNKTVIDYNVGNRIYFNPATQDLVIKCNTDGSVREIVAINKHLGELR